MFKILQEALLNEEIGEFNLGTDELGLPSIDEDIDDLTSEVSEVLPSISDGDDEMISSEEEEDDEIDSLTADDLDDEDIDEIEDRAILHDMTEDIDLNDEDIDDLDDEDIDNMSAEDLDDDEDDEDIEIEDNDEVIDPIDDPNGDYPDNDNGLPNDVLDSELLTDSFDDIGNLGNGNYMQGYNDIEEDTSEDLESSITKDDFDLFSPFDYNDDIEKDTTNDLGSSLSSKTKENSLFSDIEFPKF